MNTLTLTPAAPTPVDAPARRLHPARPMRPTRGDLWDRLAAAIEELAALEGQRAAWQGPRGAAEQWRFSTGAADLDIWCDDAAYGHLTRLLTGLDAARVQHADDPRRLRHTSFAIETNDGLAVVDLTRGDLRVGPVLMVPMAEVRTVPAQVGHRLAGTSEAADLFVRPLLRGRLVDGARLDQARAAWRSASPSDRTTLIDRLRRQLSAAVATGVAATLDGAVAPTGLARAARIGLVRASLRPSVLSTTWRQRRTILPARGRAGLLGLRTKGALIVLVGTDGSGKSTVATEVENRVSALGLTTTPVYMGMARGNLPGVALARKLLGVAPAADTAPAASRDDDSAGDAATGRQHAMVRRVAAWFYAVEYLYRWWRDIRPGLRDGGVVIADRYVYDLRESPWPGSRASRVAEFLMPTPDVLVLPDAPDALIHARKPERAASEQAEQQGRFRDLVAAGPAGTASLTVDTSGMSPTALDPVAPVIGAVVTALHRMH